MKSTDKEIIVHINGTKTELRMKLGSAGEAYFISEAPTVAQSLLSLSPAEGEAVHARQRSFSSTEKEGVKGIFGGILNKKEDEEVKIDIKIEAQREISDRPAAEMYDSEEDVCTIEFSLAGDQLNE